MQRSAVQRRAVLLCRDVPSPPPLPSSPPPPASSYAALLHAEAERFAADVMQGKPYLGVHLRRNDWTFAHANTISDIDESIRALKSLAKEQGLEDVFIATDAQSVEMKKLYVLGAKGARRVREGCAQRTRERMNRALSSDRLFGRRGEHEAALFACLLRWEGSRKEVVCCSCVFESFAGSLLFPSAL